MRAHVAARTAIESERSEKELHRPLAGTVDPD